VEFEEASPELIAQAKSGDHGAFAEIYKIHVGRVYGICLRVVGDRSRAEEATQQVFVRLWMKLHSFRGDSSFGSWLHRLSLNVALNELKASASMPIQGSSLDGLEVEALTQGNCSRETQMDLENAIAALPAGARVVFVLHEIEGFSHKDIADELGLANGTSKAQLSRARKLLRGALKKP
jgi:RNA polymerase sigma factor (sigma-70 family)